jgi:uncharacterized protein
MTTREKTAMVENQTLKSENVLGEDLEICGQDPVTGFYRTGYCQTGPEDRGTHTVCAVLTQEFLDYTKSKGNDLSTPAPEYGFPGLKPGQRWCLCAIRWLEAYRAGKAPPVILSATHQKTLDVIPSVVLKSFEFKLKK